MKVTKVLCDRCGKEIKGNYIQIIGKKEGQESDMNLDHEYCETCTDEIFAFANASRMQKPPVEVKAEDQEEKQPVKKEKSIVPVTENMSKNEKIQHLYNQGCSSGYIAATLGIT